MSYKGKAGFTLIELLVVIGVIAVLATIILLAVNPGEQLARGRDANRISAVTQLGKAVQSYYTTKLVLPAAGSTWMDQLVNSQDLRTVPKNPKFTPDDSTCVAYITLSIGHNGYCYFPSGSPPEALIFTKLESSLNIKKCPSATPIAWTAFTTKEGRGGIACTVNASTNPNPNSITWGAL